MGLTAPHRAERVVRHNVTGQPRYSCAQHSGKQNGSRHYTVPLRDECSADENIPKVEKKTSEPVGIHHKPTLQNPWLMLPAWRSGFCFGGYDWVTLDVEREDISDTSIRRERILALDSHQAAFQTSAGETDPEIYMASRSRRIQGD